MTYLDYLDYLLILLALIAVVQSWILYRITRSRGILCIFFAMILGVAASIAVTVDFPYNSIIRLGFWTLWIVGLQLLISLLTRYYRNRLTTTTTVTHVSKDTTPVKEVIIHLDKVEIITPETVISVPGKVVVLPKEPENNLPKSGENK